MSLGQRTARHQTVAAVRTAGVNPEDYWEFKPGQKVMTADGFAGHVAAVEDGPIGGAETYIVELDNGLGGGQYTASLLRAMPRAQANVDVKTAADDYPELGTILEERPPLALSIASSLQVQAGVEEDFGDDERRDSPDCTACGGSGELSDGSECSRCDASGEEPLHKSASKTCPDCDGDGERGTHQNMWGIWETQQCRTCGGEGDVPDDHVQEEEEDHRVGSKTAAWGRSPAPGATAHVPVGRARCEGCGWSGQREAVKASLTCPSCDADAVSLGARDYTKYPDARQPSGYGRTAAHTCPECKGAGDVPLSNACMDDDCPCSKTQSCPSCEGTGRLGDHESGEEAYHDADYTPRHARTAAYNEGDPDKYTSSHRCPECGSDRALESVNGVIKCEDCGHEQQNGQADGWTKSAHILDDARKRVDDFLNMHVRPTPKPDPLPDDLRGLSVDISPLWPDRGRAKSADHGRTAAAGDWNDYYAKPPAKEPAANLQTCLTCGRTQPADHGGVCAQCGTQMVATSPTSYGRTASRDPFDLVVVAATDPEFRFHVTASYADVRSKAKRLRAEGRVNIISVQGGTMVANVKGDHAVYETEIVNQPGKKAIAQWHCGCKWGAYAWGRQGAFKRFEGRLCSHALALHFEAQSQGMFGRTVTEEQKAPDWLKPRTRVVVDFDRDDRRNVSRPAQPRKRDFMRTYSLVQAEESPVSTLVRTALAEGVPQEEILVSLRTGGIDARGFFSEARLPGSDPDKKHHRHKGDQAPCARAGCGHPEGIHGDNGATCLSDGCDCRKFTTVPSQPSDKDNSRDSSEAKDSQKAARRTQHHHKQHHHKHHHVTLHHLGTWPLVHGGYFGGYGWGGCGICGGSYGGGAGDSGGDGDGGGDGGGTTASLRATADFPATMDPTFTPGNDVRPHDGSQGFWNATSPHDPNANPGSTGWASGADPDEFKVDSSAFGRMGSLGWPTLPVEAKGEGYQKDWWNPFGLDNLRDLKHDLTTNPFKKRDPNEPIPVVNTRPQEGLAGGTGPGAAVAPVVKNVAPKALPKILAPVEKGVARAGEGVVDLVKHVPKPRWPGMPKAFKGPQKPVPGKPGVGTPAKPGAPTAQEPLPQSATPRGGNKPGKAPGEAQGPKGKGESGGKGKGKTPAGAAARAGAGFVLPQMPQIPKPDYYRESDALIGGHGIGTMRSRSALVSDLLRQEAQFLTLEQARQAAAITEQESIKEQNHAPIDLEATLHDDPEAALPQTDGDGAVGDPDAEVDPDGDVEGLASHGSVEDIVAEFQRTAGATLMSSSGAPGAGGEDDVAAAAKAFLQTEAMKTFSPAEQRQIIDEGKEVTASNLDRLDIAGTHYEPLEAALAKAALEDDDDLEL